MYRRRGPLPLLPQTRRGRIAERESDYQQRRLSRILSPERVDPFADASAADAGELRVVFAGQLNFGFVGEHMRVRGGCV